MKRIVFITLGIIIMSSMSIFAQQKQKAIRDVEPAKTKTEVVKTTVQSTEVLSPFYTRTAKTFTDRQIRWVNSDCLFELNSKDIGGTGLHHIEYAIDDDPYQKYTTAFKLEKEGNRIIRFKGIDNSRNVEKAVLYQVYVDNTPPAVSVATDRELYKPGDYLYTSNKTKFYIAARDDESGSGVNQTYAGVSIDKMTARGTGISSETNFFKVADGVEGLHEFYFTAVDNVGNMAHIQKYNIIVDNTPPIVDIDKTTWINITAEGMVNDKDLQISKDATLIVPDPAGGPNSYFVNGNYQIGFKAVDPRIGPLDGSGVSAIYVKVNDENFIKYRGPIRFERNNTYKIIVKAEDNAGNLSDEITYNFNLDFISPSSNIIIKNTSGQRVE